VVAQKGGSAKRTVVVHLAVEALREGRRVAIIDIDSQPPNSVYDSVWLCERCEVVQRRGAAPYPSHKYSRLDSVPVQPILSCGLSLVN
jgi:CobQ/CobB/MinD/ParA nucleotide binding domain